MRVGIDAAVERHRRARAELAAQRIERAATGVAQDDVVIGEAAGADVWNRFSARLPLQRDRRVEVVEDAMGRARVEQQRFGFARVRTERGDDPGVGIVKFARGKLAGVGP